VALAAALGLGAAIGLLLGLMGGGGSIVAVPALVYVLGLSVQQAIPVSLIVVGIASAVGVLPKVRAGHVQWRLAAVFAASGIPGALAGSAISRHLDQSILLIGFAVVMVAAGVQMLRDNAEVGTACEVRDEGVNWGRCAPRAIPTGLLVGLLTGLFGVGGGFLIIPALVVLLGVEMAIAVGTSLAIIVANSVPALISHLGGAHINWAVTAAFAGGAVVASLVFGHVGTKVDTGRLQHWFAYLVFTVAAYVLIDTIVLQRI
jgi:uncharacterized protein